MSILRILGVLSSLSGFIMIFFRLRYHSKSRSDVVILTVFSTTMLLVSLFPGMVNLPADVLSLGQHERGRLFTLLIFSTICLWFLLTYERSKVQGLTYGFDQLVRSIAIERFNRDSIPIDHTAILVIIPAYNEEDNLLSVVSALPIHIFNKPVIPLVVDDGSQDGTVALCVKHNIAIVSNPVNRGGGAALRVGFDIALDLQVDIVVTMDGDGQHRSQDLETLVLPIIQDEADLVIGSRSLGEMEKYSTLRYWGVILFGRFTSILIGQKITDPASGYRAFTPEVISTCLLLQDQYHTAELIIEAAKHNMRISEQPITIKKRLSGKSKKGRNIKYALYFLRTILRTWIR